MRKYLAIIFLSLAFLVPAQSQAQGVRDYSNRATGFLGDIYLGLKYGELTYAADDSDLPEEGQDIRNAGVVFGRLVNEYVGWEFEYTYTATKDDITIDDIDYGSLAGDTLGIFLVAKTRGDVYAKGRVGYMRVTQQIELRDDSSPFDETNAYGVGFGFGGGVKIGKTGAIEFEYTRHPNAEYNFTVDLTPVGGPAAFPVELEAYTDLFTIGYIWSFK